MTREQVYSLTLGDRFGVVADPYYFLVVADIKSTRAESQYIICLSSTGLHRFYLHDDYDYWFLLACEYIS